MKKKKAFRVTRVKKTWKWIEKILSSGNEIVCDVINYDACDVAISGTVIKSSAREEVTFLGN